ncbi:DNA polymerase Y family protein [Stutzerimonas nosocomialis]|uniref:Y-family DNA polymerase n=1 Tax=Stutzerimonas nosocomialis TaxID=1056496 RepID=UPI001109CC62|nr:DNA polymerase Y family protein [Stutzerimonas nosocomialis]TLX55811.1 DNA polymerase Y family protein [Stutzerimonas nosocomialis]
MRWACIVLPQLALDGVLRGRDDADTPLALISGTPQRRILQTMNEAARALGLRPGQSLIAAQAVTRHFATLEYDMAEVERLQNFLAAWAYRFSSHVSLHYPRALLMEVESSLGLFGPWPRFEARLREELTALGFRHRIVLAPNPAAARILANAHDGLAVSDGAPLREALGRMPIDRVGLSAEVATSFSRMGLRTLDLVLALPRDTVTRRFPKEVLRHLDTLVGMRPLTLQYYAPPDEFDLRLELNYDVASHQALLFPLRRLTADLAAFLAGRDSGVQRFTLHLEHREREDSLVPVGLLSAEREASMLFELARGRLEQLQIPAPAQALRLVARDLPVFVPEHRELFNDRPQQSLPWDQLRERLRARLGDEAVLGLRALVDHRPERTWQLEREPASSPLLAVARRPGWLLREPVTLRESAPRILAGPERIESGWWDGGDVRRDYYLIETRSGRIGWAYRAIGQEGPLLLQGWFS